MAGTVREEALELRQNLDKVYKAGKQAEYDRTWDTFQSNGKRRTYTFAFAGNLWDEKAFFPKYDIVVAAGHSMFYYNEFAGSLKKRLEQQGVTLTFVNTSTITNLYSNAAKITELGVIDFSTVKQTNPSGVFQNMTNLHTIEKLILPPTLNSYDSWFKRCSNLECLTIEGTIANNISFSDCTKLTHDSLTSIIYALSDNRFIHTKGETLYLGDYHFHTGHPGDVYDPKYLVYPDTNIYTTTTGEEVFGYVLYTEGSTYLETGLCCQVDGVWYHVTEEQNTDTRTLTLDATNLAKLEDWEIAHATETKGWTVL